MSTDIWEAFGNVTSTSQKQQIILNPGQEAQGISRISSRASCQVRSTEDREELWKLDKEGASVLFDASEDGFDDFGDFENAVEEIRSKPPATVKFVQSGNVDLLGLDDFNIEEPGSQHTSNRLVDELSEHLAQTDMSNGHSIWQHVTGPQHTQDEDEPWGTFEDAEPRASPLSKRLEVNPSTTQVIDVSGDMEDDWDTFEDGPAPATLALDSGSSERVDSTSTKPSTDPQPMSHQQERPTNIPPPFLLLQIMPPIFSDLARLSSSNQEHTSEVPVAQRVVDVYCVTARIISGRSHRWKRDAHLSQSMRISQAGVKSSGMKLTSLDRGETIKEDQQVLEVVSAWTQNSYRLSALLARAKLKKPPMQLSASMTVRVASGAGVLTAKDVCPVCGLKRNERVLGIDVNVQDTFGEFWIEHWGHRDCYEFWYTSRGMLDHR